MAIQTNEDYTWFFENYLYTAKLPKLEQERVGDLLTLYCKTEGDAKFTVPVEVKVGNKLRTVLVSKEPVSIKLPNSDSHYIVDPLNKILKEKQYLAEYNEQQLAE